MRLLLPLALLAATAACSEEKPPSNALPSLETMTEDAGNWSALDDLVGRRPAESGLVENSPIEVDLSARLGRDSAAFRDAMMRAGPLERSGPLMMSQGPDAWLVIQPGEHAFHAALKTPQGWKEWSTPGAAVPVPQGLPRA